MVTWYCVECGYYQSSQPDTERVESLRTCPLCGTLSIVDLDRRNAGLQNLVQSWEMEFPSMRFDDPRPQYGPLNYLIQALAEARHFIHIAAESLDELFLGMLSLKFFEEDIDIKVILWHPQKLYRRLDRLWDSSIIMKGYLSLSRENVRV